MSLNGNFAVPKDVDLDVCLSHSPVFWRDAFEEMDAFRSLCILVVIYQFEESITDFLLIRWEVKFTHGIVWCEHPVHLHLPAIWEIQSKGNDFLTFSTLIALFHHMDMSFQVKNKDISPLYHLKRRRFE